LIAGCASGWCTAGQHLWSGGRERPKGESNTGRQMEGHFDCWMRFGLVHSRSTPMVWGEGEAKGREKGQAGCAACIG
jgi:hypothetical protein